MARARAIAAVIASRAPIAAGTAKANLKAAVSMPLEKAIEYERELQTICFATEDAAEGRAALKEKRSPVFQRRCAVQRHGPTGPRSETCGAQNAPASAAQTAAK
jgi:1,4-dihydroxy-2-naphthoyl-CoA synthase